MNFFPPTVIPWLPPAEGGAIVGGYNPDGWDSQGDDKSNIAAFLFVWPDGDLTQRPIKLPKAGA